MSDNDKSAFGFDDPNRGPLDQSANAMTEDSGGLSSAMNGSNDTMQTGGNGVASAMFDSNEEAQQAVSALRQMGASDNDLSIIAQSKGTMTTRKGGGEVTDEEHSSILRGILGGGALGAGLGIAALDAHSSVPSVFRCRRRLHVATQSPSSAKDGSRLSVPVS